jgi:hypothetical protein
MLAEVGNPDLAVEHRHMAIRMLWDGVDDSDVARLMVVMSCRDFDKPDRQKAAAIIFGGGMVLQCDPARLNGDAGIACAQSQTWLGWGRIFPKSLDGLVFIPHSENLILQRNRFAPEKLWTLESGNEASDWEELAVGQHGVFMTVNR